MAQVKIKVTGSTTRQEVIVDNETTTPKDVFNMTKTKFDTAICQLDGATLEIRDMNTTLAELGVTSDAYLVATIKTNNAA
jgi:BRCT domain type II-containing protein